METQATSKPSHIPKLNIRELRYKLSKSCRDMTQKEFSERFGIPAGNVRNWEQGRRQPDISSRLLLAIIDRHPEIVEQVWRDIAMTHDRHDEHSTSVTQ